MWLDIAKESGIVTKPRDGKTVYTGSVHWYVDGLDQKVRIVFQVIERTGLGVCAGNHNVKSKVNGYFYRNIKA